MKPETFTLGIAVVAWTAVVVALLLFGVKL